MRGADLLRAKVHYPRLTQRRPKGVELALSHIAQFEPVGFGEAERVPLYVCVETLTNYCFS